MNRINCIKARQPFHCSINEFTPLLSDGLSSPVLSDGLSFQCFQMAFRLQCFQMVFRLQYFQMVFRLQCFQMVFRLQCFQMVFHLQCFQVVFRLQFFQMVFCFRCFARLLEKKAGHDMFSLESDICKWRIFGPTIHQFCCLCYLFFRTYTSWKHE